MHGLVHTRGSSIWTGYDNKCNFVFSSTNAAKWSIWWTQYVDICYPSELAVSPSLQHRRWRNGWDRIVGFSSPVLLNIWNSRCIQEFTLDLLYSLKDGCIKISVCIICFVLVTWKSFGCVRSSGDIFGLWFLVFFSHCLLWFFFLVVVVRWVSNLLEYYPIKNLWK